MGLTSPCVLLVLSALLISGNTQAPPTATVNILSPPDPLYPGDTVTLQCDISQYEDWNYYFWFINDQEYKDCTSKTCSFKLVHNNLQYSCSGRRSGRPQDSYCSDILSITVTALPTATVNILSPPAPHYPGDLVTLQCDTSHHEDWSYIWFINGLQDNSCTSKICSFDLGFYPVQYSCSGRRSGQSQTSQQSPDISITITAFLKATLTVTPNPVYHGETVSLKCSVESGPAWSYRWYKDGTEIRVEQSGRHRISGDSLTISKVESSDQGQYWCRGGLRSIISRGSESQYLIVNALPTATVNISPPALHYPEDTVTNLLDCPQPVLRVSPSWLNPGDSVTLSCEVGDSSTGWSFSFYRAAPSLPDQPYSVELLSDREQTTGNSSTLQLAAPSHTAGYMCRAGRGETVYYSDYSTLLLSNPQFHWSGDLHSSVSLSVSTNRSQHLVSESVSLSCELKGNSTGWTLRRYSGRELYTVCSSVKRSTTGSTCIIRSLNVRHSGVFWCESGSGEYSNAVNITVHVGPVILESPVHPVTEGDSVTLRCRHKTPPSSPKVDFYKDGNLIRNETTGEMTIPAVSQSDKGLYKCTYSDREESPQSWLLVRGTAVPVSLLPRLLCGLLVTSPFLVTTILLLLIKCQQPVKTAEEDEGVELTVRNPRGRSHDDTGP